MLKFIIATLFISQIAAAQTAKGVSIRQAPGTFTAVKGNSTKCSPLRQKVEFHSKKSAVLGSACGAVLWLAAEEGGIGTFFCNVDAAAIDKPVAVSFSPEKAKKPDLYLTHSGRINSRAVQMFIGSEHNDLTLLDLPDATSVKVVLAVTGTGIEIEESTLLKNGETETTMCRYQRASR